MILKIENLLINSRTDFDCCDDNGNKYRVDLITDGSLPMKFVLEPKKIIGKTVEVDRLTTYLSIAHEIKII